MRILAVDTNSQAGSVALLENKNLLAEVNIHSILTHSERLLPSIDFLMRSLGLQMKDIEGLALAVGPGSFTGIRIGMSTVKAFSYAFQKPIAPVSNLKALAMKLKSPQTRLLCPVLDAKKGEVFAALFEAKGKSIYEVIKQGNYSPDRFFSLLPAKRVLSFIGSGAAVYKEEIFQYFKDKARISSRSPFLAYEVGCLGYNILNAGKGLNHKEVQPLYLRKSQAEERK